MTRQEPEVSSAGNGNAPESLDVKTAADGAQTASDRPNTELPPTGIAGKAPRVVPPSRARRGVELCKRGDPPAARFVARYLRKADNEWREQVMTESRLKALCYGAQVLMQINTGKAADKLTEEMAQLRTMLDEAGSRLDA